MPDVGLFLKPSQANRGHCSEPHLTGFHAAEKPPNPMEPTFPSASFPCTILDGLLPDSEMSIFPESSAYVKMREIQFFAFSNKRTLPCLGKLALVSLFVLSQTGFHARPLFCSSLASADGRNTMCRVGLASGKCFLRPCSGHGLRSHHPCGLAHTHGVGGWGTGRGTIRRDSRMYTIGGRTSFSWRKGLPYFTQGQAEKRREI